MLRTSSAGRSPPEGAVAGAPALGLSDAPGVRPLDSYTGSYAQPPVNRLEWAMSSAALGGSPERMWNRCSLAVALVLVRRTNDGLCCLVEALPIGHSAWMKASDVHAIVEAARSTRLLQL